MAASEEQMLSLEEVAERLQVSDQTVRRWIKSGRLRAYKPGLEWRIRPSDLDAFLETRISPKAQASQPSAEDSPELRRDALAPTEEQKEAEHNYATYWIEHLVGSTTHWGADLERDQLSLDD